MIKALFGQKIKASNKDLIAFCGWTKELSLEGTLVGLMFHLFTGLEIFFTISNVSLLLKLLVTIGSIYTRVVA